MTGVAVGAAGASLSRTFRSKNDAPRVAGATRRNVRDYVPPLEQWAYRSILLLAVVLYVVGALVAASGAGGAFTPSLPEYVASAATAALIIALLALVATEWLSARVVARGQAANSDLELAWDDAVRAMTLRDAALVPVLCGIAAVIAPLSVIGNLASGYGPGSAGNVVVGVVGGLVALVVASFTVLVAIDLLLKPQQRYLRRLWPSGVPENASRMSAE